MTSEGDRTVPPELPCERLGDLAAAASPDEGRAPDPRAWARIEARLSGAPRRRALRFFAVAVGATAACALAWLVLRQPLRYRTEACSVIDRQIRSLGSGTVAFEDGTTLRLEPGSGVHIEPYAFARGAELALDEGAIDLAVVHRRTGRWAVVAGPFRVDVTGTRFSVRWTKNQGRFHLALHEGEVRLSGGPIPSETRVFAGQVLDADAGHFVVEEARPAPASAGAPEVHAPSPTAVPTAPSIAARPAAAPAERSPAASRRLPPRRLSEAAVDTSLVREVGATPPATDHGAAPALPPIPSPAAASPFAPESPTLPAPPAEAVPAAPVGPRQVAIGRDGQLSGGMSGYAWLSSGEGAVFSMPVANLEYTRLQPVDGKLCTHGRLARWSCVNEGLPSMRCNWDRNWGVTIGFFVASGEGAWGAAAPSAIAIDFRGRSAKYRLKFHRKGDPREKIFCIDGYKSGQVARPWQAKSRCWDDAGETLPDFNSVDHVDLLFPSGLEYVAFNYCISGITLYP